MKLLETSGVKDLVDKIYEVVFERAKSRMRCIYVYGQSGSSKSTLAYMLSHIFVGKKVSFDGPYNMDYNDKDIKFNSEESKYRTQFLFLDEMTGNQLMSTNKLTFFKEVASGMGFARRILYDKFPVSDVGTFVYITA